MAASSEKFACHRPMSSYYASACDELTHDRNCFYAPHTLERPTTFGSKAVDPMFLVDPACLCPKRCIRPGFGIRRGHLLAADARCIQEDFIWGRSQRDWIPVLGSTRMQHLHWLLQLSDVFCVAGLLPAQLGVQSPYACSAVGAYSHAAARRASKAG